jgi:hypothetical protein
MMSDVTEVAAMTSTEWDFAGLMEEFHGNPPVSVEAIRAFESELGRSLPDGYVAFLLYANGGTGFVGNNGYVSLWRLEEIFETNRAYEFDKYKPGLLAFGSDDGGEALAFDMRVDGLPVVEVPFICSFPEDVWPMAPSFYAFLIECSKWDLTDP